MQYMYTQFKQKTNTKKKQKKVHSPNYKTVTVVHLAVITDPVDKRKISSSI